MLGLLLGRPRLVGEIAHELEMSQPRVSKHLRYELRPEPLADLDAWLAPYRRLWTERLEVLEQHLETMSDVPEEQPRQAVEEQ
jgi:DNA-binding transcriptional ArsR family regulator